MEKRTKEEWIHLLKRYLIKFPEHDGEHVNEYVTPDNLGINIITQTKTRRNHNFGGPIWSATVNLSDPEILKVSFLSPLKRPHKIKWNKVKQIELYFMSDIKLPKFI